jgi:sulfur carrier protein
MKIFLPDGSDLELHVEDSVIEKILRDLGLNPTEVVVAKNSKIVSELDRVGDYDQIRIIKIIHGG